MSDPGQYPAGRQAVRGLDENGFFQVFVGAAFGYRVSVQRFPKDPIQRFFINHPFTELQEIADQCRTAKDLYDALIIRERLAGRT